MRTHRSLCFNRYPPGRHFIVTCSAITEDAATTAAEEEETMRSAGEEQHDIVIVGGGICGLALALALHRKGMKSLVLEKSEKLRAEGAAIGIWANGWRALDQLRVGTELRQKATPITEARDISFDTNHTRVTSYREVEIRCLKRSDLIEALADKLPPESIRFGCQVDAVEVDPLTSFPVVHTSGGLILKAKVLIGCDGSNSIVARTLQLKDSMALPVAAVRGFTSFSTPHSFGNSLCRFRSKNKSILLGVVPVDDKLLYWGASLIRPPADNLSRYDHKSIQELALESLRGFPHEVIKIVQQTDLDSLSLHHMRYRHPWHLLTSELSNGTMTVAGDAMHAISPLLGQGGCAALEDAIVLARCLAQKLMPDGFAEASNLHERVEAALSKYIRERRMRVMRLSTQSYLATSFVLSSSWIIRMICIVLLVIFFGGNSLSHTQYNCGQL